MARLFDPAKFMRASEWLAVAVAVSIPWSTSATGILIAAWLIALIPALDWRELRRIALTPAGGLPVLLVLLGAAGMLWADVSLIERWRGFGSFLKLLVIPLLFFQFRNSERGLCVFGGFLASCMVLLTVSIFAEFVPGFSFIPVRYDHVIVKNAATQSGEFVICIFGLLYLAVDCWERRRWRWLIAAVVAIVAMVLDILYVATGRTALATLPILLALFAARKLSAKGAALLIAAAVAVAALGWFSSAYLRERTTAIWTELQTYETTGERTSSGERLEFWDKSADFIRAAPVTGHGTGTIVHLFTQAAAGKTGTAGVVSANPHNQTLAVAIQLGVVGALVLWAMWIAHLLLFRGGGLAEWIGLVVVAQNIVGSLFNSHLFDFVQGWIYVFGAGVAGGIALKNRVARNPPGAGPRPA